MGIQAIPQPVHFPVTIHRNSATDIDTDTQEANSTSPQNNSDDKNAIVNEEQTESNNSSSTSTDPNKQLTAIEQRKVDHLKKQDLEVKAHEMAHVSAGGQYIRGSVNYQYKTGPDGNRYAVGGDVSIDLTQVPGDPNATISKMQVVKQAALAPMSPSSTDIRVAAKASRIEAQARIEASAEMAKSINDDSSKAALKPSEREMSNRYSAQAENNKPIERGQMVNIAV